MISLTLVFTHFTMSGSREMATYPDNVHFWPISGPSGTSLRPDGNCMTLKSVPSKSVQPGSVTFPFIIGNGASHIGLCSAFLEENGKETHLNDQQDCISKFQAMTVDIPNIKCNNCVLKIKVAADHLGPTIIENYDSCLDITIGDSNPTTTTQVLANAVATPSFNENPTTPVAQPKVAPPAGASAAPAGYVCSADGKSYIADGYTVQMADGTKCVPTADGIAVAFS